MRRALLVAAVLALTGIVWILQGVGILPGSFMSGDITWTYIGSAVLAGAVVIAFWALRHRST